MSKFILFCVSFFLSYQISAQGISLECESDINEKSLVGLNQETGKARAWQSNDPFLGVSVKPSLEGKVVFLSQGIVELESRDLVESQRYVYTSDAQFIGHRLADGRVFLTSHPPSQGYIRVEQQELRAENSHLKEYLCRKNSDASFCK